MYSKSNTLRISKFAEIKKVYHRRTNDKKENNPRRNIEVTKQSKVTSKSPSKNRDENKTPMASNPIVTDDVKKIDKADLNSPKSHGSYTRFTKSIGRKDKQRPASTEVINV